MTKIVTTHPLYFIHGGLNFPLALHTPPFMKKNTKNIKENFIMFLACVFVAFIFIMVIADVILDVTDVIAIRKANAKREAEKKESYDKDWYFGKGHEDELAKYEIIIEKR